MMFRSRSEGLLLLEWVLLEWLLLAAFACDQTLAQSVALPSIQNWTGATQKLDSQSQDVAQLAETWLRKELANPQAPIEAAWSLALFCYKRGDMMALKRVIEAIGKRYPNPPSEITMAFDRFRLSVAIFEEDRPTAETAFNRLVRAILSDQVPKADKLLDAATIGTVIGMLEPDAALSPISDEILAVAKRSLDAMESSNTKNVFAIALADSRARSKLVKDLLILIEGQGIDQLKADHQANLDELAAQQATVKEIIKASDEISRNAEEQIKANRVSIRRINQHLASLAKNWQQTTPGYPGPEKPAPVRPVKSAISVDPYKTEYVNVTDSNGNQTSSLRRVDRSYAEQELEREQRFGELDLDYRREKSIYDLYLPKYRAALAGWQSADRARRDKIKTEQKQSEARKVEMEAKIEENESERKDVSKQLVETRTKVKILQLNTNVSTEVLRANATGKPQSTFRPGFFETISVGDEKSRLLKLSQEKIE